MEENKLKQLENEVETSLKDFSANTVPQIDQINKLLNQEYEKEINDQINFLRNITVMAGVVAPLSLTLLLNQSLDIQKSFLILGFIFLLITVLVTLIFSKKLTINKRYKDTPSLALNHIIAKSLVDDLSNKKKPLSERTNTMVEILKSISDVSNKFSDLGYTNKIMDLRNRLSQSNQWSIFLFSFGIVFIIISVIFPHVVKFLSYLFAYTLSLF